MENNVNNVDNMNVVSNIINENQVVQDQINTNTNVLVDGSNVGSFLDKINPNIYLAIAGGSAVLLIILIILLLSKKKKKKVDTNIDQKELDVLNNNLSELKTQVNPVISNDESTKNSIEQTNSINLQSPIEQTINSSLSNGEINNRNSVDLVQNNNNNNNVVNDSPVVLQSNLGKDIMNNGSNIGNVNSEGFNNVEINQINELENDNIDSINNQINNLNNNNVSGVNNTAVKINDVQESISEPISDNVVLNNNIDLINNQNNNDAIKINDVQENISGPISSFDNNVNNSNNETNNKPLKQSIGFGDLSNNIINNNEVKFNDNNLESISDMSVNLNSSSLNNDINLSTDNSTKKIVCPSCGSNIDEGDMFCVNCGNKIN